MFLSKIHSCIIYLCIIKLYTVEKKYFCCYCLKAFSTEEILKHIKDCFKANAK